MKITLHKYADRERTEKIGETVIDGDELEIVAILDALAYDPRVQGVTIERMDKACDFCSDPDVVAIFQITPGQIIHEDGPFIHMDQDGKWGCCKTCREFIESAPKMVAMRVVARRAMDSFIANHPELSPVMGAIMVAEAHSTFWVAYDGSAATDYTPEG